MFNDELHHEYEFITEICSQSSASCTVENIWDSTKKNSVPFQKKSLVDGDINEIPGIGKVVTRVDNENYTLVNETLPGHSFEHGKVTRSVIVTGNSISVHTLGVGVNTGLVAYYGNYAASLYFPLNLDKNIMLNMYTSSQEFHNAMSKIH